MILSLILLIVIVTLLIMLNFQQQNFQQHVESLTESHHEHVVDLTESWSVERSELLDRIQAPTFGELKNAEIKMVKAQQPEEPKPSFILE